MSSFVEVRDLALEKAVELIKAIEPDSGDGIDKRGHADAASTLTNTAIAAANAVNDETWAKSRQERGVPNG